MVASRMLQVLGHTVVLANNGKEALEIVTRENVDLVLMDVQMPEMDGLEATVAMRKHEKQMGVSRVPVIALTAHAIKGDQERCIASGMDGYLTKPINLEDLRRAIADPLPGWAVRPSSSEMKATEPVLVASPSELVQAETALDREAVLKRMNHNRELIGQVVMCFQEDVSSIINTLREAMNRRDGAELSRTAHSLKEAVGTLGAKGAFQAALTMERVGEEGKLSETPSAFATLEQELQHFQRELAHWGLEGYF
jgi:CheY-like chemotaxis protein